MGNKKQTKGTWWKVLILLTFIISLVCLILLLKPEPIEYEYEILHIKLNNTNDFSYVNGEVIDYLCDENVGFTNHGDAYYASTIEVGFRYDKSDWEYRGYGECMIKIKRIAEDKTNGK